MDFGGSGFRCLGIECFFRVSVLFGALGFWGSGFGVNYRVGG